MRFWTLALLLAFLGLPAVGHAEWYVAGQGGLAFADRLSNVEGTGPLTGVQPVVPHFDLKNSAMLGAKLGYFPGHGYGGIEVEAFHTSPNVKPIGAIAGVPFRVTTVAVNLIIRYPGVSVQPYAGLGLGIFHSRIGNSPTTLAESDTRTGMNLLAGVRFFVTPYVSVFSEYKLTQTTFRYDQTFAATSGGGFIADYLVQFASFGVAYHF